MYHIISLLIFIVSQSATISKPMSNVLTLKLKPIAAKDTTFVPKTFSALFAKIPQDITNDAVASRREILSKAYFQHASEIGVGCTNQIAKILLSPKDSSTQDNNKVETKIMNMPLIQQPFEDYKIVIATAPANMMIGKGPEKAPLVVYIVFPDEESSSLESLSIPLIYFVKKPGGLPLANKSKAENIIIVDNNRTVTGLKSKEVAKFVRFKNKLINRYNYKVE